tara:strand:- start:1674 stop:2354 length:681 start_codon:yes stop_codon:yes gene_type:complete
MKKNNAGVEAVDKALKILNAFREKRDELTLTEISNKINQYKSTTSRLCTSLLKFGYIERLPNKKFRLGNAINRLINVYDDTFHINNLIQKQLNFIKDKTNETASFWIKSDNTRVCILKSEPEKDMRHNLIIGQPRSLEKGSSGHIISTYHDLKTQNRNKVLKDEFSISHGEIDPEKASVTVPLLSKQNTLLGAISVSGHVSNFNKTNTLNFLSILKNSRNKLEKQI